MINSQSKIYYGLHCYPGVAEYRPDGEKPFRVRLTESTLRNMDKSFQGKPVYVLHVDEVTQKVDKLKNEVDGWVVRSFYNEADGKHWCQFIVCSERGEEAIRKGWRLSNAYIPQIQETKGQWNGVDYEKEVLGGTYEHMAIVPDPRYAESIILTPEKFKAYNDEHKVQLKLLANQKEPALMKFNIFKRTKVENAADMEGMMVILPITKREVSLETLINEADKEEVKNGDDISKSVKVGEEEMTVNALIEKYCSMKEELENFKAKNSEDEEKKKKELENEKEEEEKKKKEEELKNSKDKEKAEALKNAEAEAAKKLLNEKEVIIVDAVELGKQRYGS